MISSKKKIQIDIIKGIGRILVKYLPKTDRTIYDICDLNGRVVKTGTIKGEETSVDSSDLFRNKYIMLIVDGDEMISQPFVLA